MLRTSPGAATFVASGALVRQLTVEMARFPAPTASRFFDTDGNSENDAPRTRTADTRYRPEAT